MMKRIVLYSVFGIIAAGALALAAHSMVFAKLKLSGYLMQVAWAQTLRGEEKTRPWPWMESYPVAEIIIPKFGRSHIIMSGVSRSVMAVAAGWHEGTDLPGKTGISLISTHAETPFYDLKKLSVGDSLYLTTLDGQRKFYEISALKILEHSEIRIDQGQDSSVLLLTTTYPFKNWQQDKKMQFVAVATEVPEGDILQIAGLRKYSL